MLKKINKEIIAMRKCIVSIATYDGEINYRVTHIQNLINQAIQNIIWLGTYIYNIKICGRKIHIAIIITWTRDEAAAKGDGKTKNHVECMANVIISPRMFDYNKNRKRKNKAPKFSFLRRVTSTGGNVSNLIGWIKKYKVH